MTSTITLAGAEKAIEAHYCNLVDASRATDEILGLARLHKCDTVVIGRDSLSWLVELIHGDPAEELVRQGKGFTIWVVECSLGIVPISVRERLREN